MHHISFYKQENHVAPLNFIGWLASCIFVIIFLSYLYIVVGDYMPIIYLNIAVTVIYGIVIGILVRFSYKLFKINNKRLVIIISIVLGLFAYHFAWLSMTFHYEESLDEPFTEYLTSPAKWFDFVFLYDQMSYWIENGTWIVYGGLLNNGLLGVIWLCEILILTALPCIFAYHIELTPFSKKNNTWYEQFDLIGMYSTTYSINDINESLARNPIECIQKLGSSKTARYTKISVYYDKSEDNQYIRFQKKDVTSKNRFTNTTVIPFQLIDKQSAETLVNSSASEKPSIFQIL